MSTVRADLKYSVEHEWTDGGSPATIGVTQVAADALGDVVYVDLPEAGATVTAGEVCGEIESTKSVSDLFSPVTGEVVEVNQAVIDDPALVNSDPYGEAWLFRVAVAEEGPLLSADEYAAQNDATVG
ncbi:MAG: glycine cleavage system protein GcvH [Microbacteriaceae bacterium]|nr:glycine cleavage system protein GcvH [Microbacteriaceae bacterium]